MQQQPQYENTSDGRISAHATRRMHARNISQTAVHAALEHGRTVHVRGAVIHAIGRKEVARLRPHGIDLSQFEGIQIVCAPDGTILTTYRNRDFRSLRPRRRTAARNPRH